MNVAEQRAGSVLNQIVRGGDGNLWFTEQQGEKIGRLVPP